MTKDFTVPSNKTTEKIVAEATSYAEMVEGLRQAAGRGDPRNAMPPVEPAALPLPAPMTEAKCIRVIYPAGNSRFELYGVSEAELDAQEQRIRQLYQQ
jgi:hypothetical protein